MLHFSRGKKIAVLIACIAAILYSFPSMVPHRFPLEKTKGWPAIVPHKTIKLGLDLQGGSHLLLALDETELRRAWFEEILDDVRARLRNTVKVPFSGLSIVGNNVQVRIEKPENVEAAMTELSKIAQQTRSGGLSGIGGYDIEVKREGQIITLQPTEQGLREKVTSGMTAAIETIRRRVDALGTTEPNIVRQGSNQIVVQVPGLTDPAKLKELVGKTAKMTFHFVHPSRTVLDARREQIPPGYIILPSQEAGEELIERRVMVHGEDLVNAFQGFDEYSRPSVNFRFNPAGARKFYDATRNNVGRRFAIVLDGKVISAPQIITAIPGGSGQITGSFTTESANNLAILLRSGALPATLTIVEERTVGASLGQDSINAGTLAAIIGCVVTAILVIIAYGTFGLFAVLALTINGLMLLAIMSVLGATLTLPGIAGIVLTIGMAVDSNVLIFERIREELRNGKTPINAIDAGFRRALVAIADSQLTTLAAALLMFGLGSGPVRGFAVTLSIGIFTSVFTAVTVTRLIVSQWLQFASRGNRKIEIPI